MKNLCFDIGGMSTKIAIVENKRILKKDKIEYNKLINSSELIKLLINYIEKNINLKEINNISISSPGVVDSKTGEIKGLAAIIDHNKMNYKVKLENKFNKKVFIENDAKCAALAELMIGNGKNFKNFFVIVIGTGIGGTIIINNQIYKGSFNCAGELGCFLEDIENSKYINLSNKAGMYQLENNYQKLNEKFLQGKCIYDLYKIDKIAKKVIDEQIYYLAKEITNVSFILDFEKVLIGGAVSQNQLFINLLSDKLDYIYKLSGMEKNFVVEKCKYINDSNLLGANLLEEYNDKIS